MSEAKILVVDDEKNIRMTVAKALDPLGYKVHTAFDGKDALYQLQAEKFDLILTDLQMPGMNGMELLGKATELYPEIKIALISAHGTVDNAVEAMKIGAVDFLQKPFTPKELRDLVYRMLEESTSETKQTSEYESCFKAAENAARKREFTRAITHAKKAIGLDPSRPEAFNLLGMLQETTGDRLEGIKNYRIASELDVSYRPAKDNLSRATGSSKNLPTL
ncbi:MAG: response regulator [Spirulinaceae cyanobacterium]